VNKIIKKEEIDVCIVSYGGSCSNILAELLEENGYKCRTNIWHKILCHCPEYIKMDIPVIYIYDNIMKSYLSMKRRGNGVWDLNQQKLSNNKEVFLSDENLFQLMIKQYRSWTCKKKSNILLVKTSELFQSDIKIKLQNFLRNENMKHFPIEYIPPKTSIDDMEIKDIKLFRKYIHDISEINNRPLDLRYTNIPFVYKKSLKSELSFLLKNKPVPAYPFINERLLDAQVTDLSLNTETKEITLPPLVSKRLLDIQKSDKFLNTETKQSPLIKNFILETNYEKINKLLTNF